MRRRWLAFGLAALFLLAIGIAVGRATTDSRQPALQPTATVTVAVPAEAKAPIEAERRARPKSPFARTPEGAAAAANAYLTALSGPAILDPDAVARTLTAIAAAGSRDELVSAYQTAAGRLRRQLGVEETSRPSVLLRVASVGYRVDGFQRNAATVSVWRVGIVASGASIPPRQSWRTDTVSLVWENGTWKIDAVRSSAGPTPPLAGGATPAEALGIVLASFEEFVGAVA